MTETDRAEQMRRRLRILLAVALVMLVLLLIALGVLIFRVLAPDSPPSSADLPEGLEWVRSIYGYGPSESEQLVGPNDAAVAGDGTIWVTDGQRSRILAFSPDGTYQSQIYVGRDVRGPGGLYRPDAIDISESGEVYIADYGNQRISVFSQDNEFLREWGIQLPQEVAVRDGRVVVGTRRGVAVFGEDGELITQLGQLGKGPLDFDTARGVAIDEDGTMYFADTHNKRIKAYSPEGDLLWVSPPDAAQAASSDITAEATTTADGEYPAFQLPVGMTIDGSGRLVVLDAFDFQLVVLDPEEGRLVARYGEYGAEDGRFVYPTGIAYDYDRDWFVVADTSNNRAQIVRIPGSGGSVLGAVRRAWATPIKLCAIPLILLLIAAVVAAIRRRRRASSEELDVAQE